MNVYLSDEIVFDTLIQASEFISKLPSFTLSHLNVVHVSDESVLYQVIVYCFDDEVNVDDYL